MANRSISPADLPDALRRELEQYYASVVDKVNAAGESAAKSLVQKTKATAPKRSGDFRKSLTYETETVGVHGAKKFTWGARAPHHRRTHLLVNGHATVNGGRVAGDPFLQNALDSVLPEYVQAVEEAVRND